MACNTMFDSAEIIQRKKPMDPLLSTPGQIAEDSSLSSSSSIGNDSDDVGSQDGDDGIEGEVQSDYKGPLQGMGSLEESLPIRRGISNFYNGKSKSFTSLLNVVSSFDSAKNLAKEDNAYTRKRRNLLAFKTMCDRSNNMLKSSGGGIAKKPAGPARSTVTIAAALSCSSTHTHVQQYSVLPPLPRPGKSPVTTGTMVYVPSFSSQQLAFSSRSFSLGDLSEMATL